MTNEFLCGHIVFATTASPAAPTPRDGAYNATVARQGPDDEPVIGGYVITVGAALAPPIDADADINCTVSQAPVGRWANATVTFLGFDTDQNRLYGINIVEAAVGPVPAAGTVVIGDTAGVLVKFTVKRVEPRTS